MRWLKKSLTETMIRVWVRGPFRASAFGTGIPETGYNIEGFS